MIGIENIDEQWSGYSFEELQYRRLLTQARINSERQRLYESVDRFKSDNPLTAANGLRKVFNALSFVDYLVMGLKIIRRVKPLFTKSKKS